MNTAAKIIAAPLPSILDIFLARCSSKATSIVTPPIPPTVSSSSYHQEDGTGASEPAPPDCSTVFFPQAVRALNSTHLAPLWNPIQTPYHLKHGPSHPPPPPNLTTSLEKSVWEFSMQFEVCYTQVSGPAQTTCSNTLSSTRTRHISHIIVCT